MVMIDGAPRAATHPAYLPAAFAGRSKLRFVLTFVGYYCTLWLAFRRFMLPVYGRDFLERNWVTVPEIEFSHAWSLLVCAGLAAAVHRNVPRARDYLLQIHLAFPIIPMLVLFGERGAPLRYVALFTVCFLVVVSVAHFELRLPAGIQRAERYGRRRGPSAHGHHVGRLVLGAGGFFVIGVLLSGGLSRFNLNFDRVYEFRGDNALSVSPILGYLSTNLVAIGLPLAAVVAVGRRQYAHVAGVLLLATLIFGFTSHKSHFFSPLIALAVYAAFEGREPLRRLLVATCCLVVLAVLLYEFQASWTRLGTWTVRRGMFGPAYLNYIWYDFFGVRGSSLVYWSDSSVSFGLVRNPYGASTPLVIGAAYDGKGVTNLAVATNAANTGWLGAGFAHAGVVGMLLYSLVVGFAVRSVNQIEKLYGSRVAIGATTYAFFLMFTTTDVPSSLLSHGTGAILLLAFLSRHAQSRTAPAESVTTPATTRPLHRADLAQ